MDYEEFDLLADVSVLDVDLPTFLDDYQLPADCQFDVVGGVTSLDSFSDLGSYAVNEFDGENCSLSKSFNDLEHFSLLCTQNSSTLTSNQRQNSSSPFLAPWHENFVDVEDEFAIFAASTNTENSFLQNVLQQAETDRNVDDFLDIVEQTAQSNLSEPVQNPQQILEEIYRECHQIDSLSPRLVSESEFMDGGVVEVVEYFSPIRDDVESEDDDGSRSCNYTPESCTWSESTRADSVHDSDHNFASSKSKKSTKKQSFNCRGASIKKKTQNRVAASRYRSKKKLEKGFVETEVSVLEEKNVQLKTTVGELEREISYLKNFMTEIRKAKGGKKKKLTK